MPGAGRPVEIRVNVFDTKEDKMILEDVSMPDAAKALKSAPQRISRAKNTGGLVKWRYKVIPLTFKESKRLEELDNYALEWEVKELCKRIRRQIEPSILRRIPIKEAV